MPEQGIPMETVAVQMPTKAMQVSTNGAQSTEQSTLVMVDHLWTKLREVEASVAAGGRQQPPPPDPRVDTLSKAVSDLADGLDRLFAEVGPLHQLPERLDALERRLSQQSSARVPYDQSLTDTVEQLASRVRKMEDVPSRIEALERAPQRRAPGAGEAAGAQQLEQLSAKVATFDSLGTRLAALEQAKRISTDRDLATLAERMTKLERRETRAGEKAPTSTKLHDELERLTARVAVMEKAPNPAPAQAERLTTVERVLDVLVRDLERLAAQVAGSGDLPKRMAALEEIKPPPPDKVLASLTKRLDRLSTQVSFYKDVPARLEATEQSAARVDSLTQGLRRAVESIDHLSAQVKGLEPAASASAPTDIAAPAPAAEVSQATPQLPPAHALEPQPSEDSTTQ